MDSKSQEAFLVFAKPFIEALKNVFETMVFTKVEAKKPEMKTDNVSRGDVSSMIGMNGVYESDGKEIEFKGMLVISWPEDTYVKTASAMLMEEHTEYNDEIADTGSEIVNIIMGNAKRDLAQVGYKLEMAIPSMIGGKNHTIKYPNAVKTVLIPLNCSHGDFFMEICFKEIH